MLVFLEGRSGGPVCLPAAQVLAGLAWSTTAICQSRSAERRSSLCAGFPSSLNYFVLLGNCAVAIPGDVGGN